MRTSKPVHALGDSLSAPRGSVHNACSEGGASGPFCNKFMVTVPGLRFVKRLDTHFCGQNVILRPSKRGLPMS